MKATPTAGRRPAAPAVPPPEAEDVATVLMRAPGRGSAGARPARAPIPEPESDEPSTIVMRNLETEAPPRAGGSAAPRGAATVDRTPTPPPIGQPPVPPEGEHPVTETAPVPVLAEPRRSILTLALGGIGLVLFFIVLSTALIVLWKRKTAPPAPSPTIAQTPSPVRPSAPAVVTRGLVHVESIPAGATISVDGNTIGKTPLDVEDLTLGAHEVKVELDGYAPAIESVMLTAQTPRTEVRPTLSRTAPATGTADVSSTPAGAMVKIDATAVGLTPLRGHTLNVGRHRVEIVAEGYDPYSASVTVKEGQTVRLDPQLRLKVVAVPSPKVVVAPTPPAAPTPDPHVYDENDTTLSAKPVKTGGKSAEYPREAMQLKRGQRASVTCSFVVLEGGDVSDVQVVESAGEAVDNAVVTAYKSWKFTPGMKQGAKVKVRVTRRQTFLGG
jgi:TonB family protein